MILYFDPLLNDSTDSPLRTTACEVRGSCADGMGSDYFILVSLKGKYYLREAINLRTAITGGDTVLNLVSLPCFNNSWYYNYKI